MLTRRTLVFREYLRKNERVRETVLPVQMGPRLNLLSKKNGQKSRDIVNLSPTRDQIQYHLEILPRYSKFASKVDISTIFHTLSTLPAFANGYFITAATLMQNQPTLIFGRSRRRRSSSSLISSTTPHLLDQMREEAFSLTQTIGRLYCTYCTIPHFLPLRSIL